MIDLEQLLQLVFNNPNNIDIQYSNVNGKESFIVNGQDILKNEALEESFDDSRIKEKIKLYKENLNYLDEWVWNLVIDEAANRNFNISEMDKILNLNSYTKEEAIQADNTIDIMCDLIQEILEQEIQALNNLIERF